VFIKMVFARQYKKSLFLIVLLPLILMISACLNNDEQSNLGDVSISLKTPPYNDYVVEGKPFSIIVEAVNSGDYETPISICVSDTISPGTIPETERVCARDNIEASNGNSPGTAEISFGREFVYEDVTNDNSITTIKAKAEFDYVTSASKTECLKGEEANLKDCKAEALERTKGPIYVESINVDLNAFQETIDPSINIRLAELSDGSVVGDGIDLSVYFDQTNAELICDGPGLNNNLLNWGVMKKSEKVINCVSSQPIDIGIDNGYQDKIKVELRYKYEVIVAKTLTIKDSDKRYA